MSLTLPPSYSAGEIIGCGPANSTPIVLEGDRKMIPLPGWGNHQWKIETSSDSAQFYFNQGLSLFYGFHMSEAQASFKEAQRHDPSCAMAYWGQAMAEGPYINAPQYNSASVEIINGLSKAASLAKNETERSLVAAQQLRYGVDKNALLSERMQAYAKSMRALYEKNISIVELAVLYADALMMINSRDWYDEKGTEKKGTAEIVLLLEKILKMNPSHPAALHYYIHIVEPSTRPERAAVAADVLLPLMPSVAHMVHMPSHIYIRTGSYTKGITSNVQAIEGYRNYQQALKGWTGNRYTYFFHNADMQGASAVSIGDYEEAKKAYGSLLSEFKPTDSSFFANPVMSNVMQYLTAQLYLLDVRFGKWQNILNAKETLSDKPYHQILWQFGKGMAAAKTDNIPQAKESLAAIRELIKHPSLQVSRPNRNSAVNPATIALLLLNGTIELSQKNFAEAVGIFESAVRIEDALRYSEPEDWRLHARHYLGQALLEQAQWKKAQLVFEEDLKDHPANFWALNGLHHALQRQNKTKDVTKLKETYAAVFNAGPKDLTGATY